MKSFFAPSVIFRITAAGLLFWALSPHQYGYYTILRWVVFAVSSYCTYVAIVQKQIHWAWLFGFIGLFINPFFPVRLNRESWAVIDTIFGIVMIFSIFFIREKTETDLSGEKD